MCEKCANIFATAFSKLVNDNYVIDKTAVVVYVYVYTFISMCICVSVCVCVRILVVVLFQITQQETTKSNRNIVPFSQPAN